MSTGKPGRPTLTGETLTRCTVFLTPAQVLSAHTAGSGNVSDGLRKLLDDLARAQAWHHERLATSASQNPVPRKRHQ